MQIKRELAKSYHTEDFVLLIYFITIFNNFLLCKFKIKIKLIDEEI